MKVEYKNSFIKNYRKRIHENSPEDKKFIARLKLFEINPQNPILRDHSLTGNFKGLRSFSVTGDIRVIYYIEGETAYFIDIGSHNQVY